MLRRFRLIFLLTLGLGAGPSAVGVLIGQAPAAPAPPNSEWRTYGADLRSTRYMPLDQITRDNFSKLQIAWRLKTDALGPLPEFNFQVTPLVVNGVLYTAAGSRRTIVALDAESGEMLWMHRLDEGRRGQAAPRRCRDGASPIGPTASRTASSTSRLATRWSRSTRRPASRSRRSARTALST